MRWPNTTRAKTNWVPTAPKSFLVSAFVMLEILASDRIAQRTDRYVKYICMPFVIHWRSKFVKRRNRVQQRKRNRRGLRRGKRSRNKPCVKWSWSLLNDEVAIRYRTKKNEKCKGGERKRDREIEREREKERGKRKGNEPQKKWIC